MRISKEQTNKNRGSGAGTNSVIVVRVTNKAGQLLSFISFHTELNRASQSLLDHKRKSIPRDDVSHCTITVIILIVDIKSRTPP